VPDVVHIHALWTPILRQAHKWAQARHIPVVVMTHGALSPWAMASKRWKKLPYWWMVERPALKRAVALHVTAEHEGRWARDLGFTQPLINVSLGVDVPESYGGEKVVEGKRLVLMVGRIYEVKGLDRVARAIRLLKDSGKWTGWKMVMAGPNWMGYQPQLKVLIFELGLKDDIALPGSVYGEAKEKLFRQASIYISASHTENFCQPVAEALAHGVPAVASKGTPWEGLDSYKCGIWTENDPESLAKALETLMEKSDEERLAMGLRGRKWMMEDFSWDSIGKKLLAEFERVVA